MRISDWSSDVCSSDLAAARTAFFAAIAKRLRPAGTLAWADLAWDTAAADYPAMLRLWMQTMSGAGLDADALERVRAAYARDVAILPPDRVAELVAQAGFEAPLRFHQAGRSEEHTSELQSLMRISYAVFCLKKKTQ